MQNTVPAVSRNEVRTNISGNRALRIIAKRNASKARNGRQFLQTTAIGDNHRGVYVQVKTFKVARRVGDPQTSRLLGALKAPTESELLRHRSRQGVDEEDDRDFLSNLTQRIQDATKDRRIVNVRWAVKCQRGEAATLLSPLLDRAQDPRELLVFRESIDHDNAS
jgi:hypothetical protein